MGGVNKKVKGCGTRKSNRQDEGKGLAGAAADEVHDL